VALSQGINLSATTGSETTLISCGLVIDDNSLLPAPHEMTDDDIGPVLGALTASYPAFRFQYVQVGRLGDRWIAERASGTDPGLHTVITEDVRELHHALNQDLRGHAR
jgi:hypothetical protein